jgi:uncharacterized glyoxalase superfamily protein PhnB
MSKPIYPCLWFDGKAKEAATFYCGIFKNSKISFDSPMVVKFELNGVEFMGLNGGPIFKFNESVSYVVECDNQVEIDYYWTKLTEGGGNESMCGWLKDKFGLPLDRGVYDFACSGIEWWEPGHIDSVTMPRHCGRGCLPSLQISGQRLDTDDFSPHGHFLLLFS